MPVTATMFNMDIWSLFVLCLQSTMRVSNRCLWVGPEQVPQTPRGLINLESVETIMLVQVFKQCFQYGLCREKASAL